MSDAWDTFSRYGLLRDERAQGIAIATPLEPFLRSEIVPRLAPERS
jgi:hypothetical protein